MGRTAQFRSLWNGDVCREIFGAISFISFLPLSNHPHPHLLLLHAFGGDSDVFWPLIGGGEKSKEIRLGFWFFAFMLSVTLQIVPIGSTIMADRYSYIAFIGLGLVVVGLVDLYAKKEKKRQNLKYIGIAIALLWSVLTWKQVDIWEDSESLWTHRINHGSQELSVAYSNRGEYYKRTGKDIKANRDFAKALSLNPDETGAIRLRAKLFFGSREIDPSQS